MRSYAIRSYGSLLPQAYDPGFTNYFARFNGRAANDDPGGPPTGPIRTNPVPFALVGNAPAIVIAAQNPNRKGLFIQNLDPTETLYVGFGCLADINGLALGPRGYILLDFVCPTDTISVFATANVRGYLATFAPTS